jgi:2-polyprenyl-3-methyl-5-hydroxy-6-metoxy-1,4-benzoquinol methylase
MPLITQYARAKKLQYFFSDVPKDASILEIGCADGWVGEYLKANGWQHYRGMDLFPPADIVGDILKWQQLGIAPASYDVIVAFEVVEHVDCFAACYNILKPGGRMMMTTPVPHWDWLLKIMESCGLNQRRTSPHNQLTYLRQVSQFPQREVKIVGGLSQWAIFTKPQIGS